MENLKPTPGTTMRTIRSWLAETLAAALALGAAAVLVVAGCRLAGQDERAGLAALALPAALVLLGWPLDPVARPRACWRRAWRWLGNPGLRTRPALLPALAPAEEPPAEELSQEGADRAWWHLEAISGCLTLTRCLELDEDPTYLKFAPQGWTTKWIGPMTKADSLELWAVKKAMDAAQKSWWVVREAGRGPDWRLVHSLDEPDFDSIQGPFFEPAARDILAALRGEAPKEDRKPPDAGTNNGYDVAVGDGEPPQGN